MGAGAGMTPSKVPRRREGADVQLVQHQVGERVAVEALVGPGSRRRPSTTAEGPWTPSGWWREAGSGR